MSRLFAGTGGGAKVVYPPGTPLGDAHKKFTLEGPMDFGIDGRQNLKASNAYRGQKILRCHGAAEKNFTLLIVTVLLQF